MSDYKTTIGWWFQENALRMKVGDYLPDHIESLLAALDRDGFAIVPKEQFPPAPRASSREHKPDSTGTDG